MLLQVSCYHRGMHPCSLPGLRAFGAGFLILLGSLWASDDAVAADLERHVILITIDGFPASFFWDSKIPLPHLRELAKAGVAAEGIHVSDPTITWPNHTTLVTGVRPERHSVLFNGILRRKGPGEPVHVDEQTDKSELVAVPNLFDVLHEQGLRTAAIDWPCTRNSPAIDDNFPDAPQNLLHTTARLRQELIAREVLASDNDKAFQALSGPGRDDVWTEAACQVIRERKPHLLALHLLNTDGIQHRYGPGTPASATALRLADAYVGQVLQAVEQAGLGPSTTIFITADHGFAMATNLLQPNVILRRAGLLELGPTNQIAHARAQVVPEGGTAMVYLTDPKTRASDRQQVIDLFRGAEGIDEILTPDVYHGLGLPLPQANPGMADLVLAAKDNYMFSGSAAGEAYVVPASLGGNVGTHGYLASNPHMVGLFVAAGRGIKPQGRVGIVNNLDVAPTIARLLGVNLPSPDGAPLTQILDTLAN